MILPTALSFVRFAARFASIRTSFDVDAVLVRRQHAQSREPFAADVALDHVLTLFRQMSQHVFHQTCKAILKNEVDGLYA